MQKIKTDIFQSLPVEPKKAQLRLHEALDIIEGRESTQTQNLHLAKHAVEQHLAETTDLEEKATSYYYLLRILLAERLLVEHHRARELYDRMYAAFRVVEEAYITEYRAAKSKPEQIVIKKQLEAFYQLTDSYLKSLELIYEEKGLRGAYERVHTDKMRFRRRAAHFGGRHFLHAGHLFLEHSSNYGHSFLRWGVTVAVFMLIFAAIYGTLDYFADGQALTGHTPLNNLLDYFYFSMVTFTTVGYGDIVPLSSTVKILAGLESILGYLMLGIFITLIQKRL